MTIFRYTTVNGTPPYTFAIIDGALPDGITLDPSTGALTGTATTAGTFSWTVRATDSSTIPQQADMPDDAVITMADPLTITGGAPAGLTSTPYTFAYTAAGGLGPYTYAVTTGTLPLGLTLSSSTGVLSGTPTTDETQAFTVTVTDSGGYTAHVDESIAITTASSGHRYWRINLLAGNGYVGSQIAELQLRGIPGGADLTDPTTAITAAYASNSFSSTFSPDKAFDDDTTTVWFSDHGDNQKLAYDFGSSVSIRQISLMPIPTGGTELTIAAKDFNVEWSDDNSGWTIAWEVRGQTTWTAGEARTFSDPNYFNSVYWNYDHADTLVALTHHQLTATRTGSGDSGYSSGLANLAKSTGKWYFEFHIDSATYSPSMLLGIANASQPVTAYIGSDVNGYSWNGNSGLYYHNSVQPGTSPGYGYADGDVIGVHYDADNGVLWFSKNGVFFNTVPGHAGTADYSGIDTSVGWFPAYTIARNSAPAHSVTGAFRSQDQVYAPQPGFLAWDQSAVSIFYAHLDPQNAGDHLMLSARRKRSTNINTSGGFISVKANQSKTAGKWYFEVTNKVDGASNGSALWGFMTPADPLTTYPGSTSCSVDSMGWQANNYTGGGSKYQNGYLGAAGTSINPGGYSQFAIDFDAGKLWVKNSNDTAWVGGGNPATGASPTFIFTANAELFPALGSDQGQSAQANFGGAAFHGAVPSGFNPGWYTTSGNSDWMDWVFTDVDVGAFFDFTNLSTMYTDSGGTVPCTAAGDTVASVRDIVSSRLALPTATAGVVGFDATLGKYGIVCAGVGNAYGLSIDSSFSGSHDKSMLFAAAIDGTVVQVPTRIPPLSGSGNAREFGLGVIPGDAIPNEIYLGGSGNGIGRGTVSVGTKVYAGVLQSPNILTRYEQGIATNGPSTTTDNAATYSPPSMYFGDTNLIIHQAMIINRALGASEVQYAIDHWQI